MSDILTRLLLFSILSMTQIAHAGSSVSEKTCADYLGIDKESQASKKASGDIENKKTAYKIGLKLGVSMRQGSMANWVQGYLVGYASAMQKSDNTIPDIDNLRSKLRMHCSTHQDQTMRQVADEFNTL